MEEEKIHPEGLYHCSLQVPRPGSSTCAVSAVRGQARRSVGGAEAGGAASWLASPLCSLYLLLGRSCMTMPKRKYMHPERGTVQEALIRLEVLPLS